MVIAALVSFAILLIAWIAAPERPGSTPEVAPAAEPEAQPIPA